MEQKKESVFYKDLKDWLGDEMEPEVFMEGWTKNINDWLEDFNQEQRTNSTSISKIGGGVKKNKGREEI